MEKIKLVIVAVTRSLSQMHNYAVVLREVNGDRRIPISIGSTEAQAIAVALEQMIPSRPLTHDLFKNAMDLFQIDLKSVLISNLIEGIFHSTLILENNGEELELDARTSDAIALAIRFDCPIYTTQEILDSVGVIVKNKENSAESSQYSQGQKENREKSEEAQINEMSIEELEEILTGLLESEKYEQAAIIRDEIKKRSNKNM